MAGLCAEDNIAMTPYSPLAGGRLSRHPGETSKRLKEDGYARLKYDAAAEQDSVIIRRVEQLLQHSGSRHRQCKQRQLVPNRPVQHVDLVFLMLLK